MNSLFRLIAFVAVAVLVSFSPGPANAQISGNRHPVVQQVIWELTANSEISRPSLERMATVILDRLQEADLPLSVRETIDVNAFKTSDPFSSDLRYEMMRSLNDTQLKQLVILPAPLEYYEIPEAKLFELRKAPNGRFISHELSIDGLDQAKHLVKFNKDGEAYVRWFIHPLDGTPILNRISQVFKTPEQELQFQPTRGSIKFHFTASRSLLVFENSYDEALSVKLSLPYGEGPFRYKTIHLKEWTAWIRHNAYLVDVLGGQGTETLKLLYEPFGLGVGVDGREDGFLFRRLDGLTSRAGRYYLPAFAALDEHTGAEIARRNGSADPLAFWEKNLLEPLAKGMAELRALTGAEHTSPHSQNLLIELDRAMRPTGKVVLRDFDFYIDDSAFKVLNRVVEQSNGLTQEATQMASLALRNGLSKLPPWMTDVDYERWIEKYFDIYQNRFSAVTGISRRTAFGKGEKLRFIGKHYIWSPVANVGYGGAHSSDHIHGIEVGRDPSFAQAEANWLKRRRAALGSSRTTPAGGKSLSTPAGRRVRCEAVFN